MQKLVDIYIGVTTVCLALPYRLSGHTSFGCKRDDRPATVDTQAPPGVAVYTVLIDRHMHSATCLERIKLICGHNSNDYGTNKAKQFNKERTGGQSNLRNETE
jgi:hypothetical protein